MEMGAAAVARNGMQSRGEMGRGRREIKGVGQFLNPLMFLGFHVTDEHKQTVPHVPFPPNICQFATSPRNISGQCQVRYRPVICLSVT
jgi:hypothetical protein